MSLPLPPPPEDDSSLPEAHDSNRAQREDDVERTEAFWHPGMSRATYIRLLRLLFDPVPLDPDESTEGDSGGRAA